MASQKYIDVEVAYALPHDQVILSLRVPAGTTAEQAVQQSGIQNHYPEIDLASSKLGIFSKVCPSDRVLETGDRVEIYRPLIIDPKEKRRRRAEQKEKEKEKDKKPAAD